MKRLTLLGSIIMLLVGIHSQHASAEEDHIVGYLSKDLDKIQPGGTYTFTNGLGVTTCELKKAKFLFVRGEKNGGDDPRGGSAGKFVCYKAKCTGPLPGTPLENDQFGNHNLETKKLKIVCAPAQAQCESTVGGFCWFLGPIGQDCDQICADSERTYDTATDTFAGSSGSLANCVSVMNDIGVIGGGVDNGACSAGVGCFTTGGAIIRCTAPPTTSSASDPLDRRVCACQ